MKYDIFISYRRSDGFQTAQLFHNELMRKGYRVSFDVENLRSGKFNTQLYQRIEECNDVIVILSKDAFKFRKEIRNDWLRMEVLHALQRKKNIIPIFLRDVDIEKRKNNPLKPLPSDFVELLEMQGITASNEHFSSSLNKLCKLLKSKPRSLIAIKALFNKIVVVLSTILLLFMMIGIIVGVGNRAAWNSSSFRQGTLEKDEQELHSKTIAPSERLPVLNANTTKPVASHWVKGNKHPQNANLIAGEARDTWISLRPGYVWVEGTNRDEWKVGLTHPDNPKLVSDEQEGTWKSIKEGYVWIGGSKTEWQAGIESIEHPHWISIITDKYPIGAWQTMPGYSKKNKTEETSWEVVWVPGERHGHAVSGDIEGTWKPDPGYALSDLNNPNSARWIRGQRYGHAVSGNVEGAWNTDLGYVLSEPSNPNSAKWVGGLRRADFPHVISSETENNWRPEDGYGWVDPESQQDLSVVWKPGKTINGKKAAAQEGKWLIACNRCKNGKRECVICDGTGYKYELKPMKCRICGGSGKLEEECSQINGGAIHSNPVFSDFFGKHVSICLSCNFTGVEESPFCGLCFKMNPSCYQCHRICQSCGGSGGFICISCNGTNKISVPCLSCAKDGWYDEEQRVRCRTCDGSGKVTCSKCDGDGWVFE